MKKLKQFSLFSFLFMLFLKAQAAVPEAVSGSLGELKTDVTTVAGLAFAAFLVIVLFSYMRKAAH